MRTSHALLVALGVAAAGALTGCGGCKNEGFLGPDAATVDAVGCGGNTPCRADQACRYDTCVPTPPPCAAGGACPGDAYCDTTTNECLPWGVGPGGDHDDACVREVVPGVFFPGVQCEWLGPPAGDPFPDHKNVLGAPMVATFSGTGGGEFGSPSIVFISYNFNDGGGQSCAGTDPMYFGVLRVIDGRSCEQTASFPDKIIAAQSVAIADLGGDDTSPEIVAARQDGGLIAFTRRETGAWEVLWSSADRYGDAFCNWTGLSIHDLDDDGVAEVLYQGAVYSAAGVLQNTPLVPTTLDPLSVGYIPVVGDVDGDGKPELITGARLYGWDTATTEWVAQGPMLGQAGRIAIADLGTYGAAGADDRAVLDGVPEVVSVNAGVIRAYAVSGRLIFTGTLQGVPPGSGGPPTIADFDGDGRAEFASAGGTAYTVFDPDCVAGAPAAVCASGRADGVLWSRPSQDGSSNVTGSSVFDFEGDGRAEVVYADECFTRVYAGTTGQVQYSRFRRSCTWYENPVVADVDADFNAEIVVPSNTNCANIVCPMLDPIFDGIRCLDASDCTGATTCGREQPGDVLGRCRCAADADCGGDGFVCRDPIAGASPAGKVCRASNPGVGSAFGVRVLADRVDRWVNTRPIWNQHAYSVTNINDDGTVPRTSMWLRNWTQAGLNNFRQNAPGSGVAGASPDLTVRTATVTCIPGGARVAVDVCNRGTEPVARGLRVAVYGGNPPSTPGCSATTMFNLVVGQCQTVSCDWPAAGSVGTVIVDDDGTGMGGAGGASQNLECREDNNRFVLTGINCPLGP